MVRFTFLEGDQTLTTGYIRYVLSPNNVALVLILASTEMLFAKRRAVRILAVFVIPLASIFLGLMSGTNPSWDPGAYIFVIIGLFGAVSVVATHKPDVTRAYKLAAPVLAAALILLTLAVSPGVPQSAYTFAATQWDIEAVEYKCDDPASDYDRHDRDWSIMMTPSLCSGAAAYELSKVKDGCYSASEAYAHLALAQGRYANDPSRAALTAQTYLTAAWLRGRDEMESGFCVQTKNKVRTFTRSDGSGLFSVVVTEWEDIRD
jgi:fluoride ion exporter CrcB/FEX